jgi:hypothetical protein
MGIGKRAGTYVALYGGILRNHLRQFPWIGNVWNGFITTIQFIA